MDNVDKERLDRRVASNLLGLEDYVRAPVISVYLSAFDEVATDELIREALARGVVVCAPVTRVAPRRMEMRRVVRLEELVVGRYGLREPAENSPLIDPGEQRAIVVPGLAFTAGGDRLGYGGGYYDRYLTGKSAECVLIGLAYDDQVVPSLPVEPWDVRMDWIVTPTSAYPCAGAGERGKHR